MFRFKRIIEIISSYFWALVHWLRDRLKRSECKYNWKRCPVCGCWTLDYNYICPVCHWEYEWEYENPKNYDKPCYTNGNLNIYEYRELAKKNYGIKIKNIK